MAVVINFIRISRPSTHESGYSAYGSKNRRFSHSGKSSMSIKARRKITNRILKNLSNFAETKNYCVQRGAVIFTLFQKIWYLPFKFFRNSKELLSHIFWVKKYPSGRYAWHPTGWIFYQNIWQNRFNKFLMLVKLITTSRGCRVD